VKWKTPQHLLARTELWTVVRPQQEQGEAVLTLLLPYG
jgi:hypothetical protein